MTQSDSYDFLFTPESVTEEHPDKIADAVSDAVLDAAAFSFYLQLHQPIYSPTSAYGHFGRTDADLPREYTDRAAALRDAACLTETIKA